MKNFTFGLSAKLKTPSNEKIVECRFNDNRHEVKSLAGGMFHIPYVQSVCVFDPDGKAHLYLKKTDNGIVREELP